jgi:hypothetical protein
MMVYHKHFNVIVKCLGDDLYLVIDGAHRICAWQKLIARGDKGKDSLVRCMVYKASTPTYLLNLLASMSNLATDQHVVETLIDRFCWLRFVHSRVSVGVCVRVDVAGVRVCCVAVGVGGEGITY